MRWMIIGIALICTAVRGEEHKVEVLSNGDERHTFVMDAMEPASTAYICTVYTGEEIKKWDQKFKEKIAQRAQDSNLTDDAAALAIIFDFVAGHRKELANYETARRETLNEACLLMHYFFYQGLLLPEKVRNDLTQDKIDKAQKFLLAQCLVISEEKHKKSQSR